MDFTNKQIFILIFIAVGSVCNYALANSPGSLQHHITQLFQVSMLQYEVLFSLSSWISLLDVLHGYLLDRYLTVKTATVIYASILIASFVCYAAAGFVKKFWMLLLGRILLGLGMNPMMLMFNKFIIFFFGDGKSMNFVYAMADGLLWFGSSAVYFMAAHTFTWVQAVFHDSSLAFAITNAIEMCVFGVPNVLIVLLTAYMYVREEAKDDTGTLSSLSSLTTSSFRDHFTLPLIFWTFSLSVFIYFLITTSFISISLVFFERKYGVGTEYAGVLSGLMTLVASLAAPFFSFFLDRFGHNLTSFTCAALFNLLSLAVFALTSCDPLLPCMLMAISIMFSLSLWSQFQYLVEPKQYMTAYGISQTGLFGAKALGNITTGLVIDRFGYGVFLLMLIILHFCELVLIGAVWVLDSRRGFVLNCSTSRKREVLSSSGTDVPAVSTSTSTQPAAPSTTHN